MIHNLRLRNFVFLICILLIAGCQKGDSTTPSTVETDTRILVKAAFDSVDRDLVQVAFNVERAAAIKGKLDKQTVPIDQINTSIEYAYELLKSGQTAEAIRYYQAVIDYMGQNKIDLDSATFRNLNTMAGISYMRHGEIENCVQHHNHQSCFIPIAGAGVHQLTYGSSNAIRVYESLLKKIPTDLETRYLLNVAYMTLGQYPDKVPSQYRIDPSWFTSDLQIKPFRDIAPSLGINRNGHAGGVVMDDFTNDGWLDIVITSWCPYDQMLLYINNGNGTFTDQTDVFGLKGHKSGLNINQTDFNNDGWLDLYIMRGAWYQTQGDIPNTLLMNTGKNSFVDVTIKAGLTHHAPTQTSAWSDIDLDGWLDLIVANESLPGFERGIDVYINQQDGTFSYQSTEYGLTENYFYKGCVATDINNDRYPDMFFSSLNNGTFLYINQGNNPGQIGFVKAGPSSGIGAPMRSFPCWNFDFDNDGNEDLFASAYTNDGTPSKQWMLSHMGQADPGYKPKLYHNKGNMVFEEVGAQMGLNEVAFTMGCNFGDINTDGYLDFYLATGNPLYQSLVPNKMYLNMEGRKFEDVSYSGGFANIQKGHGVSFGDWDHDGDEDIYVVIGGAYDGDMFFNCLFENPNEDKNNWVVLKLTGTVANKAAIGARVTMTVEENGKERKICRTVTSGASFGANSLNLEIGLRKATKINMITVQWPCKECPDQTWTNLEINKAYSLVQDNESVSALKYDATEMEQPEHGAHHGAHH